MKPLLTTPLLTRTSRPTVHSKHNNNTRRALYSTVRVSGTFYSETAHIIFIKNKQTNK
jgi:hypothetical protein